VYIMCMCLFAKQHTTAHLGLTYMATV